MSALSERSRLVCGAAGCAQFTVEVDVGHRAISDRQDHVVDVGSQHLLFRVGRPGCGDRGWWLTGTLKPRTQRIGLA
jgi:hypothetical protein